MPDDLMFAPVSAEALDAPDESTLRERVLDAIRTVYDPEIPVNIWELGLIYRVDVTASGAVEVDMTLTAPSCPSAQELPAMVEAAINDLPEVTGVAVQVVWEPIWTPARMSDEAKLELGMF